MSMIIPRYRNASRILTPISFIRMIYISIKQFTNFPFAITENIACQ